MSTYFVAALVADYEVYPAEEGLSNVKFRVLARPGSAHLTKSVSCQVHVFES